MHATTINKVCLSGLQTIYLADLMIRAGEAEVIIAGGMESMTQAPYLLPGARAGYRLGDQSVVDSMMYDGLSCAFDHCAMGLSTERHNDGRITRARQDEFSARSHQLAAAAIAAGRFAEEIVTVDGAPAQGRPAGRRADEGVRAETTAESLAALRPAFDPAGTITAGNASQISDGGAAVLVMSAERAEALGLAPIGELVGYGQVAGPDASLLTQPSNAIRQAAAEAPAWSRTRSTSSRSTRPSPRSASRRWTTWASTRPRSTSTAAPSRSATRSGCRARASRSPRCCELRRRGGGVAAVALCGGGGQGDAAILRSL